MIEFFVDKEKHYLCKITDKVYTQADIDKMEQKRIKRDRKAGCSDCKAGYYDKWYRYNRKDGGKAYDEGWQEQNSRQYTETLVFIPA